MNNNIIKKMLIVLILLVGNSVFMMLLGPMRLRDNTYNILGNLSGFVFFDSFIIKIAEGNLIIISYAIILFITIKIFPGSTEKEHFKEKKDI